MSISIRRSLITVIIFLMMITFIPGLEQLGTGDAYAATSVTTYLASEFKGSSIDISDPNGDVELIMDADLQLDFIKAKGNVTITNSGTAKHKLTLNNDDAQIKADSDEDLVGELSISGIDLKINHTSDSNAYAAMRGKSVSLDNVTADLFSFNSASFVYGQSASIKNSELKIVSYSSIDSYAIYAWKGELTIEDTKLEIQNPEGYAQNRPQGGMYGDYLALKNVTGNIKTHLHCIHGSTVSLEGCDLALDSSDRCGIASDDVEIVNSTLMIDAKADAIFAEYGDITINGSDLKVSSTGANGIGTSNEGYGSIKITDSFIDMTGSDAGFPIISYEGAITLSDDLYVKVPKNGKVTKETDANGISLYTIIDSEGYVYNNTVIARQGKEDPVFADKSQDPQTDEPITTEPVTDTDPQEDPKTDEPVSNEPINDDDNSNVTTDNNQKPVVVVEPSNDPSSEGTSETVTRVSISKAAFKLKYKKTVYSGKAKKPSVKVTYKGNTLKKDTDYTVTYLNNKKVGKATVKIKGIGNFKGTKKLTFKIKPRATKITKLTKVKKGFIVKWNKVTKQIKGYKIQFSLKKNMKGAKTITVSSSKKTSRKVTKLKAKRTYYVRIRTYKKVNGKFYYSKWSAIKKVKTK